MKKLLCFSIFLFLSNVALADQVTLLSGKVFEGEITEEADTYIKLKTDERTIKIKYSQMDEASAEKFGKLDKEKRKKRAEIKEKFSQLDQVSSGILISEQAVPPVLEFDNEEQAMVNIYKTYVNEMYDCSDFEEMKIVVEKYASRETFEKFLDKRVDNSIDDPRTFFESESDAMFVADDLLIFEVSLIDETHGSISYEVRGRPCQLNVKNVMYLTKERGQWKVDLTAGLTNIQGYFCR